VKQRNKHALPWSRVGRCKSLNGKRKRGRGAQKAVIRRDGHRGAREGLVQPGGIVDVGECKTSGGRSSPGFQLLKGEGRSGGETSGGEEVVLFPFPALVRLVPLVRSADEPVSERDKKTRREKWKGVTTARDRRERHPKARRTDGGDGKNGHDLTRPRKGE